MIGGFFGARLFHVFFEEPAYYFEDLTRTLEIWRGGFVWYGGAIGGALTSIALARWRRLPIAKWLDVFAPILALGYALGRIACLFTGCCYGAICVLPSGYSFRYPTQAFAVLWEFAALAVLLLLEKKRNEGKSTAVYRSAGSLFACWLVIHSVGRLIMEYFRADPRGPSPLGMSLASWISVVLLIGASLWIWKKRRA
jgi:phosphatidylglycerol:prolipoprotein diacylglycerol transferase